MKLTGTATLVLLTCLSLPYSAWAEEKQPEPYGEDEFNGIICNNSGNFSNDTRQRIIATLKQGIRLPADCRTNNAFSQLVLRSDNADVIIAALESGADPDYRAKDQYSARMTAVITKKYEVAAPLIENQTFDVAEMTPGDNPLLVEALYNDDLRIIHALLKQNINSDAIDKPGSDGNSALVKIAKREIHYRPEINDLIEIFKNKGADFNQLSADGLTLIQDAYTYNKGLDLNSGLVTALIDAGASINTTNSKGESTLNYILHFDISSNSWGFKFLIDFNPNPEVRDNLGNTALLAVYEYMQGAGQKERNGIAEYLINNGADVNAVNNRGVNVLTAAVMAGAYAGRNQEVIEQMVKAGAKAQSKTPEGVGLLFYAGMGNFSEKVTDALIEAGADINERDQETGYTPLMTACLSGAKGTVISLLKAGADATVKDSENRTPLMALALRYPDEVLAEKLIKAGADTEAKDIRGKTALDYLRESVFLKDRQWESKITRFEALLTKKGR